MHPNVFSTLFKVGDKIQDKIEMIKIKAVKAVKAIQAIQLIQAFQMWNQI